jgi:hypothetical protein
MCTSDFFELGTSGFLITRGKNLFRLKRRLLKVGSSGVFLLYG